MSSQPTFTIINQAAYGDYCLAIRGGKVMLALLDPRDPSQQWMRMDAGTADKEGQPAFALVNKANKNAIKHEGTNGPMTLVKYNVNSKDISMFWTESKNEEQGFRYICRAVVITHHITANSHQVHDGRIVDLSAGTHISERWKFVSYSGTSPQTVTISCCRKDGFNLTIRDETLVLAPADPKDRNQIWVKDTLYGKQVKDEDNRRAFALVNKATGKAIKHGFGPGYLAQLGPFNPNYLDASLLWTEIEKDNGFREIRMQTNRSAVFHAFYVHELDSNNALLALRARINDSIDQRWKFEELIFLDAGNASTTALAKPSNVNTSKPSGNHSIAGEIN